jgi:hypothetical protein
MGGKLFPEQEDLHSLLSTGWFQEQILNCVYKLIASYTTGCINQITFLKFPTYGTIELESLYNKVDA